MKPTVELFSGLQTAFDHFNRELFDNRLPQCLIMVARKKNAYGYFWAGAFQDTGDGETKLDEICLNPDGMGRGPKEVLSTLVHEMAHHWQQHFGKPGKGAYHNKEWAEKMREIGLEPKSKNGKGTGTRVSHQIIPDGQFELAFESMSEVDLSWTSSPREDVTRPNSRYRIVCPECDQMVWGNDKNSLKCGVCGVEMTKEEECA